ncbi:MAG: SPASM domain-containing protein [Phycisphaerae bacterium]|nr:SPASM domain-containing protein [Phycisphaerae bacterium]
MKVIAAIEADLTTSPLGTTSRVADDLLGNPVLRRTVMRLRECKQLSSVYVITTPEQREDVAALVAGLDVGIETHAVGAPRYQERVRRSRKWALDSWRGGIGGLCCFDESIHAGALAALGQREGADVVASVPAAAVLIDPGMLDAMIEHMGALEHDTRIVFSQAPPGLAAVLNRPSLLEDLHRAGAPPGAVLTYIPDNPQLDLTTKPCCYSVPGPVVETAARVLADTQRGMELVTEALQALGENDLTAERVCRFAAARRAGHLDRLPREVEIELTTDDQLGETTIRPRGERVPRRGPLGVDLVGRIVTELMQYDDSLVVLGGFGEPLLHPELAAILAVCRGAGVFGLTVRTNGLALRGEAIDALIDHDVDVVNVLIDAHSAETYRALHGADGFDQVTGNIEALRQRIIERGAHGPLIVPEMTKLRMTLPEQEPFFDDWIRRVGWANIISPSRFAGQMPDVAVMGMAPPKRWPCGRLWSRAVVLADGTVVTCDQDFSGRQVVGNVREASLESIWTGERLASYRQAHVEGALGDLPLCPACGEWHRP